MTSSGNPELGQGLPGVVARLCVVHQTLFKSPQNTGKHGCTLSGWQLPQWGPSPYRGGGHPLSCVGSSSLHLNPGRPSLMAMQHSEMPSLLSKDTQQLGSLRPSRGSWQRSKLRSSLCPTDQAASLPGGRGALLLSTPGQLTECLEAELKNLLRASPTAPPKCASQLPDPRGRLQALAWGHL